MTRILAALSAFWLMLVPGQSQAHALDPGFLDLRQLTENTWQVLWRLPDVNGRPMAIEAVLPEICTPRSGPAPQNDGAAWVSVWMAQCQGSIADQPITVDGLELQRNDVLLRMQPLTAEAVTLRFTPDNTMLTIPADPSTLAVFASYFQLGFEHILEGWDHLLFVFALIVLVRDPWRLVGAITAFTVAHSITLALATLGWLHVPGPPVEAVIALSIVFLALEILRHKDGQLRLSEQYPWIVCFSFGLLHGLGFAGALSEIGLPAGDIPAALLAFNIGVEAGQLAFVALVALGLAVLRVLGAFQSRGARDWATTVTGYGIGTVSMYWLIERVSGF